MSKRLKETPQNRRKTGVRLLANGVSPDVGKATQFSAGQSGNPGGRPKGKVFLSAILEHLEKHPQDASAIISKAFEHAKKGSVAHWRELMDRTDGPVIREQGTPGAQIRVVLINEANRPPRAPIVQIPQIPGLTPAARPAVEAKPISQVGGVI